MVKNKKKSPGRPKKEFISHKSKTPTKNWPGRPRKENKPHTVNNQISSTTVWFVEKSVDGSKKKDLIILLLFLFSFILFLVSLYFTFMRNKKSDTPSQSTMPEITNVDTGNIDYTTMNTGSIVQEETSPATGITPPVQQASPSVQQTLPVIIKQEQPVTTEQQILMDFYHAVNTIDTATIYSMADAHLKQSNVFQTYYSKNWLSKFSAVVLAPKIVVSNIQERPNTTNNPSIKNFSYTIEYTIIKNQQKFTEERSMILIPKDNTWKIGKLLCETKGCSTMPFFNPDKYK